MCVILTVIRVSEFEKCRFTPSYPPLLEVLRVHLNDKENIASFPKNYSFHTNIGHFQYIF